MQIRAKHRKTTPQHIPVVASSRFQKNPCQHSGESAGREAFYLFIGIGLQFCKLLLIQRPR